MDDSNGFRFVLNMIRRLRELQQEAVAKGVPVLHQYQSTVVMAPEAEPRLHRFFPSAGFPALLLLNSKDEPAVFLTGIGDSGALVARALNPPFSLLFN